MKLTWQQLQERKELKGALDEALSASKELEEVRGALDLVENQVSGLASVSLVLLEEGSIKLQGTSALFAEFVDNARGLEATVEALRSECEELTNRCATLEGEVEWERGRNADMSSRPTMLDMSEIGFKAEGDADLGMNTLGKVNGRGLDQAANNQGVGHDQLQVMESEIGEAILSVEALVCEAEVILPLFSWCWHSPAFVSQAFLFYTVVRGVMPDSDSLVNRPEPAQFSLQNLRAAVSMIATHDGGDEASGDVLSIRIPEHNAPKLGPRAASTPEVASPIITSTNNVIHTISGTHRWENSAVNFSSECPDEMMSSPILALGRGNNRPSIHIESSSQMGSRPPSDSSFQEAGNINGYQTPSSTASTASYLHRLASLNVANTRNQPASGRSWNSSGNISLHGGSCSSSFVISQSNSAESNHSR